MQDDVSKLTTDIVISYMSFNPLAPADLPTVILAVAEAIQRVHNLKGVATPPVHNVPSQQPRFAFETEAAEDGDEDDDTPIVRIRPTDQALPKVRATVEDTVFPDYIICLEDGKQFKTLKRHIGKFGLTPEEYIEKWGLPQDYPMIAPNYSEHRSQISQKRWGKKNVGEKGEDGITRYPAAVAKGVKSQAA